MTRKSGEDSQGQEAAVLSAGKYRIVKTLGEGAMGRVVEAVQVERSIPRRILKSVLYLLAGAGLLVLLARAIVKPVPMARLNDTRPYEMLILPGSGTCRIQWKSLEPYVSRALVGKRMHSSGEATRSHDLLIAPVAWADPPLARIVLPDGSTSGPIRLASRPSGARVKVNHRGDRADILAVLPESAFLTVELRSGGISLQQLELPRAVTHTFSVPLSGTRTAHGIHLRTRGLGVLPVELPTVRLPPAFQTIRELHHEIERHEPARALLVAMHRIRPADGAERKRQVLEEALTRYRWRSRQQELTGLVKWFLSPANRDMSQKGAALHWLSQMRFFDLAAFHLGIEFDTGVEEMLAGDWSCALGLPPGDGRQFESSVEPPVRLVTRDLAFAWEASGDSASRPKFNVSVSLPDSVTTTEAHVSLLLRGVRAEAAVEVKVNPRSRSLHQDVLLVHSSREQPEAPRWISHRIDPAWLRGGENILGLRFKPLPGTLATGIWVLGARISLM